MTLARLKFLALTFAFAGAFDGLLASADISSDRIAAYGRVSPGERAITVALPYYGGAPTVVAELLIKEGEQVKQGQKLATTLSGPVAAAEVASARAHLATAEERLRALSAGPKTNDIAAQQATIKSLEAEVRAERARKLPDTTAGKNEAAAHLQGAVAKVTSAQRQLDAAREVRPADRAVARAEVEEAQIGVDRAIALLASTEVVAPTDGQVLKILTYPGEGGAGRGLLELGKTLVIKAEFNVADAVRVKPGARAKITSEAWSGELTGAVSRVASRVERSALAAPSTFANVDRQVVEVTIEPDAPLTVPAGAEVTVLIARDLEK